MTNDLKQRVTDEMVEVALRGRVPGGSEVWVWIDQRDPFVPSENARDVIRSALEAALSVSPSGEAVAWRIFDKTDGEWFATVNKSNAELFAADGSTVEPLYPSHSAEAAQALSDAWNEARCCDDIPLNQTLAGFIRDLQKVRAQAEAAVNGQQPVDADTIKGRAASVICEVGALCGWPAPDCKSTEAAEALFNAGLLYAHPSPLSVQTGVAVKALEDIASYAGKTLSRHKDSARLPDAADKCYAKGAADAYNLLAGKAKAALSVLSSAPAPSVEELRGALERAKARLDAIYNPEDDGLYTLRSEIDALLQVRP
ncbi:MAG TPA: hypothetical protein VMF90_12190 [Rhizobiaceae bacterium]|nr:hypothetical protein [Rhizobiaceae bacterium]